MKDREYMNNQFVKLRESIDKVSMDNETNNEKLEANKQEID